MKAILANASIWRNENGVLSVITNSKKVLKNNVANVPWTTFLVFQEQKFRLVVISFCHVREQNVLRCQRMTFVQNLIRNFDMK